MFPNTTDHTIPARDCQTDDAAGDDGNQHDFDAAPSRPYIRKTVKQRRRGTPAQIAVCIKDLSNRLLRESGYLPFAFDLPTDLRDPAIKSEFPSDKNEIRSIMVYSMDHGRPFREGEPLTLPQTDLGWIDLLVGPRDERGDVTNVHFTCHELDWPVYEERWAQLADELDTNGFVEIKPRSAKPRRKGGTQFPPERDMLVIVLCFEKVRGVMNQKVYCKKTSTSVSTFRRWRDELEARKRISVEANGKASLIATAEYDLEQECARLLAKWEM